MALEHQDNLFPETAARTSKTAAVISVTKLSEHRQAVTGARDLQRVRPRR